MQPLKAEFILLGETVYLAVFMFMVVSELHPLNILVILIPPAKLVARYISSPLIPVSEVHPRNIPDKLVGYNASLTGESDPQIFSKAVQL